MALLDPKDQAAINFSVVAGTDGLAVVGGYTAAPAYVDVVTPVVSSRSPSVASLANLFGAFLDPTPIPAPPSPEPRRRLQEGNDA
jgi:hypothetical protein